MTSSTQRVHTHFNGKMVWHRISTSKVKSLTNSPESRAGVPLLYTDIGAQAVASSHAFPYSWRIYLFVPWSVQINRWMCTPNASFNSQVEIAQFGRHFGGASCDSICICCAYDTGGIESFDFCSRRFIKHVNSSCCSPIASFRGSMLL